MKEKIFTIPVNDAFEKDSECPICEMYRELEKNAVEYTMGPSYMEDDIRALTDSLGFCKKHTNDVYNVENRLGFALVMKTHMDKIISEMESLSQQPVKGKTLFSKVQPGGVSEYAKKLETSCFVCDRIKNTFIRYIDTVLYLYKTEGTFREKYDSSKGFCTQHYGLLISQAQTKLSGTVFDSFKEVTDRVYIENMKRVRDDVEWYINKFDHKYANEPWKNSRDSLTRAMTKTASFIYEE